MNAPALLLLWLGTFPAGAQRFPDVAENRWFYEGLAQAKKDGLLVGSSDSIHRADDARTGLADLLLFAMRRERDLADAILRTREAPGEGDAEALRRHLPFFRRAQAAFFPEILKRRGLSAVDAPWAFEVERSVDRALAFWAGERRAFSAVPALR